MQTRGPIKWPVQVRDAEPTWLDLYYTEIDGDRYVIGAIGDLEEQPIPLRIESACVFGHIFRGVKCDCRYQFEKSLEIISEEEHGIVVFAVDDDARGHGIEVHFQLYEYRQHEGRTDESEVMSEMGLEMDVRDYGPVVEILEHFSIESVEIMTNNLERVEVLEENDIEVAKRRPLEAEVTKYNETLLLQEKEWLGYVTSYKTHDEWADEFEDRHRDSGKSYGYLVTYDHAEVADVAFFDDRQRQKIDLEPHLANNRFVTVYTNVENERLVPEAVDKVVKVESVPAIGSADR